jgi:hypothetical protein
LLTVAFLAAASQVPAPTTVNGERLGTAEQFTTIGPARVCMNNVMVTAERGESITLGYSGIHNGSLRLNQGKQWADVVVGEIFAQPRERGEVIERRRNSYIADASTDLELRYGLFAYDDIYKRYQPLVWISGPSLEGGNSDRSILRRIEVRTQNTAPCDVTYRFGWDVLLDGAPLVERRKK